MSKTLKSLLLRTAQLGQRVTALERNTRSNPLMLLRLKSARQTAIERVRRVADAFANPQPQRCIR